jgi:hypothetical protein
VKIVTTSDKKLAQEIRAALKENDGYCPCKLTRTPSTKCICDEFLNNNTLGACHCGLYVKIEQ